MPPITLTILLAGIAALISIIALALFLARKPLARLMRAKGKWREDDDYRRAQRAYQGIGAGATRAAWVLGGCLCLSIGLNALQQVSMWNLSRLDDLNFVVVREHARTGEILSATVANGQLAQDVTVERRFVADWVAWVREVSLDPLDMQDNWSLVQSHVTNGVYSRLAQYNEQNPVARMIDSGRTRRVTINNVTPRGGNAGEPRRDCRRQKFVSQAAIG
jgi:type IV secretory pathway TrbF-like protein